MKAGQIAGFLANERMNLELLLSADYERTQLTEEETRRLVEYAEEQGLDPRLQLEEGKMIK